MQSGLRANDWARALVFLLGTAVLIAAELLQFAPWTREELRTRDWLMRWGRLTAPNPDLVFLAIDEPSVTLDDVFADDLAASPELRSMKASGWPWTRDIYASIIEKLIASGARVVAFDMLFPTPREGDDALRAAFARHAGKVVTGSNFVADEYSATLSPPASTVVPPDQPGAAVGFVNYWPDLDGVMRRAFFHRMVSEVRGKIPYRGEPDYLSLNAQILRQLGRGQDVRTSRGGEIIRFTKGVRTDQTRGVRSFAMRSVYRMFVPAIWNSPEFSGGDFFKGKIVLLGPEGNWSKDQIETTFGQMAGPEVHLQALNAALHGEFIGDVSPRYVAAWTLIAGLIAWLVAIRVPRADVRLLVLTGLTALMLTLAGAVYNRIPGFHAHSLPVLGAVVALVGLSAIWIAWDQLFEMRERRRLRRTLERYVSKNLVREILDNPQSYFNTVGGIRKPVAIMFTDLRGFTTLTQNADSQQLVSQLNEYFNEMVRHVFEHQGTLDKFIGDAIMAEWGNLVSEGPQRDVERSVAAGLAMRAGLQKLNADWQTRAWPQFGMGIGINHGEVIVGNIGSSTGIEKMDPTVIGDAVNLASRLEGLTKEYAVDFLLGETAGRLAEHAFYLREIDYVIVKGRSQPTAIFEVVAARSELLNPAWEERLRIFAVALTAYRAGRFSEARADFAQAAEQGDGPARVFVERCDALLATPPSEAWNGVYVMTKK